MAIPLIDAMEIYKQGEEDREEGIAVCPYDKDTSEAFWWEKGWYEKHEAILFQTA